MARAEIKRRGIQAQSAAKPPALADFVHATCQFRLDPWQLVLCERLERLCHEKGQRVLIHAPPQAGKSVIISQRFPAYYLGRHPTRRVKLACYNITHATRFGLVCRDITQGADYRRYFPAAAVPPHQPRGEWSTAARKALSDGQPSFAALGLATGFVGQGCDLLALDDPYASPNDAASELIRESVWTFWNESARVRLSDDANVVVMFHRYNEDDLAGRLMAEEGLKEQGGKWELMRFAAVADGHGHDPMNRPVGEKLSPRWTDQYVADQQASGFAWDGQFQGLPGRKGGNMFQVDRLEIVAAAPALGQRCRGWDQAATAAGGDWTAGVKLCRGNDGLWYVEDVIRGQWDTAARNRVIRQTAELDGPACRVAGEQEPGPIWEEELVQMADGRRLPLKDVRVGDRIIDCTGRAKGVAAVHCQGMLDALRIETESGRVIHAAPNHPFLTVAGWVDAGRLAVGDPLALRAGIVIEPDSQPTPEECRLAGYFVGDGCCTKARGKGPASCNATITCSDPEQAEDMKRCVESIGAVINGRNSVSWGKSPTQHYNLSGGIRPWLHKAELAGKGTDDKCVPRWILTAPDDCVANFIGAFFACDGCVSNSSGGNSLIELYNTNRKLLEEIQSLLLRFGIFTRLRVRTYQASFQATRKSMYRLVLRRGDDSQGRFAERIPVYGRKRALLAQIKRREFDQPYLADAVASIESCGPLPCRCITVEGGESFLVNDVVVHNSGGKDQAVAFVRLLAGFAAQVFPSSGSKEVRADPLSAQVNAGNVRLVRGPWNKAFIDEVRQFPLGKNDDQVDGAATAFRRLCRAVTVGAR